MPRVLRPCGTRAAAARHRRHREPLCDACKAAEREREVARYWGSGDAPDPGPYGGGLTYAQMQDALTAVEENR